MLKILPQLFYQTPFIKKILVDGLSCIIHKELTAQALHKEGYVSTHAITIVLKGNMKVENDEGFLTTVAENQIIFLPKGLYMISDTIPKDGKFEAVVFFFGEDLINEFISSINLQCKKEKSVSHMVLPYAREIRTFTDALLQLYTKKEQPHRNLTNIKLLELLHLLITTKQGHCFLLALATLNNKERRSLKEFMSANFSKPLTIEDYAYLTGRSLSSFRRDFIEQFGVSPKSWLIEKRLDKAKQLLTRNHTSVSSVALETGYENISHFVKAFHKRYAISPKQFLLKKRKEVLV
jgi:AraC-like DNA-binding protein